MLNKTIRSILSLVLVFCLLLGMSGNAIALAVSNPADNAFEKVDPKVYGTIDDLREMINGLRDEIGNMQTDLGEKKQTLSDAENIDLPDADTKLDDLVFEGGGVKPEGKLHEANRLFADAMEDIERLKDKEQCKIDAQAEFNDRTAALTLYLADLLDYTTGNDAPETEDETELYNAAYEFILVYSTYLIAVAPAEGDPLPAEILDAKNNIQAKFVEETSDAKFNEYFEEYYNEALALVASKQEQLDDAKAYIDELNKQYQNYRNAVDNGFAMLPKAWALVNEVQGAIDSATATADRADALVTKLETTYEELRTAVTNPEPSVSYIKELVTKIETEYNAIWDELLNLNNDVDALVKTYDEVSEKAAALEGIHLEKIEIDGVPMDEIEFRGDVLYSGKDLPPVNEGKDLDFIVEVKPLPETVEKVDGYLDKVISAGTTLNVALATSVAAVKKVVAKALDVAEDAVDLTFKVLNNLNKEGAKKVYDWLYNNPDKVCAAVKEFGVFGLDLMVQYGPYALDLLENHADLAELGMKLTLGGTFGVVTLGAGVLGYAGSKLDFLTDYKDDVMNVVRKLYAKYGDEAKALVKVYVEYLDLEDRYYNATHANYTIFHDSLYLAIGDSTAVGPDSYVDKLAELLEIPHMTQNLAEMDLTVEQAIELVKQNAELVGKADLITLGFSNIDASIDMLNALNQNLENGWTSTAGQLVGKGVDKTIAVLRERMAAYGVGEDKLDMLDMAGEMVDKALRALNNKLIEKGLDEDTINMVMASCEAYLASYVTRMAWYPVLVEAVYDINPDAQIIIVGTYNDLENVEIEVANRTFDIGQLTRGLIAIANLENLAQAFIGDECIYVHASAVETIFEENDYENLNNLGVVDSILNDEMLPSEAGHTYIAEQIREALNVEYKIWGDVNGDRKVNCRDARLILQYTAGLITEDDLDLTWADVNGDGVYNSRDARMILRLRVGQIEHFPVCQFSEE